MLSPLSVFTMLDAFRRYRFIAIIFDYAITLLSFRHTLIFASFTMAAVIFAC